MACSVQGQTRRIVVFVVGGITRSEIRVAHKLSTRLGRDIILGGTSADIPSTFVKGLAVSPLGKCIPIMLQSSLRGHQKILCSSSCRHPQHICEGPCSQHVGPLPLQSSLTKHCRCGSRFAACILTQGIIQSWLAGQSFCSASCKQCLSLPSSLPLPSEALPESSV